MFKVENKYIMHLAWTIHAWTSLKTLTRCMSHRVPKNNAPIKLQYQQNPILSPPSTPRLKSATAQAPSAAPSHPKSADTTTAGTSRSARQTPASPHPPDTASPATE